MDEEQNNEAVQKPVNNRKGFNITSMILGIIAVVCTCVWYINIPCSIIAIIFSIAGKNDAGRGMGIAGMVLGIVALALYVILIVIGAAAMTGALNTTTY